MDSPFRRRQREVSVASSYFACSSSSADYHRHENTSTDDSSPRHCRKRRRLSRCNERLSRCNNDLGRSRLILLPEATSRGYKRPEATACGCGCKRVKRKRCDDSYTYYTSDEEEQSEKRSRNSLSRSKIIVFWDRENCPVPKESESLDIARNIKAALEDIGLTGEVEIRDYSDTGLWPCRVHNALTGQALSTLHVPPSSRKDTSDKKIIADMLISAWDNKESRTLFMLISSDADFAYMLSLLRMRNYPILLACNNNTSKSLIYNGDVLWMWKDIANGNYEAFNQRQTFINYLNWDRELASIDAAIRKRRKRCGSY